MGRVVKADPGFINGASYGCWACFQLGGEDFCGQLGHVLDRGQGGSGLRIVTAWAVFLICSEDNYCFRGDWIFEQALQTQPLFVVEFVRDDRARSGLTAVLLPRTGGLALGS